MNFIFVSPNFPDSYYMFCQGLKDNGVNVLGIGDTPYDCLDYRVRDSLTEYYYVHNLFNYDEKYRAVAYFASRYGRIDFIESNNEFWLEGDAHLRTDFNVCTGPKDDYINYFKSKIAMKECYAKAGVKTARYIAPKTLEDGIKFVEEVGYPVVVKPDNGVGAAKTYKIKNIEELTEFYQELSDKVPYIMEEYINGDLISFDGVCNDKGDVVVPTHHVFPTPIMEIVNGEDQDMWYYTNKDIPLDLFNAGQAVLKAFGAKSRFYHLEFFRLKETKLGLGNKGDIIGLEVNMRCPGGYTPDMIDYAYSTNIYKVWADVMTFNENRTYIPDQKQYCVYYGRRNKVKYVHSIDDVFDKYRDHIRMFKEMPEAIADAMGDYFVVANFSTKDELQEFSAFLSERE